MLSSEILNQFDVPEVPRPEDAKPGIPREAPVRKEPEIPNPTIPRIPQEPRPIPSPVPLEPIKIPAPVR